MKTAILPLLASAAAAQSVLELGVSRIRPHQGLSKRATYAEDLANNITGGGYYIDITVGTPPQPQTLVLDTGSSDLWVVSSRADLCNSVKLQGYYQDSCGQTYSPEDSKTYKLLEDGGFQIKYLDGSGSAGDYISDDVAIGDATVKGLQLGYASETVRGTGIMGVGFGNHVAARKQYPNIMDQLVSQKVIGTKAYSLYLNDRRSDKGTILFGGVDTAKFVGPLSVVPIIEDETTKSISTFTIAMSGLNVTFPDGSAQKVDLPVDEVPALLDSGTTLSYVPESMAAPLFEAVGAYTDHRATGLTFIDCKYLSSEAGLTMSFTFSGGATIAVPVYEMVLDVFKGDQTTIPADFPFDSTCLFGMQSTGSFSQQSSTVPDSNLVLLGDTFLRSAYVVYDITHAQIGLAPANLNSSDSNIVELQASDTAIPAVTGVSGDVANTGSPTSGGGGGGGGVVTVTASPSPKNAASRPQNGPGAEELVLMAVAALSTLLGGALVML